MQIKSKISTKVFNVQEIYNRDIKTFQKIGIIYGTAKDHEVKVTTFGDSIKFIGEFVAEDAKGEEYVGSVLYLPRIAESLVLTALLQSEGGVEFGFEFGAEYSEKGEQGFSWTCKPLLSQEKPNALMNIKKAIDKAAQGAIEHKGEHKPEPEHQPDTKKSDKAKSSV